jgi:hypothetical protein
LLARRFAAFAWFATTLCQYSRHHRHTRRVGYASAYFKDPAYFAVHSVAPTPRAKNALGMGHASAPARAGTRAPTFHGMSWPADTSGSRPLFGEDVVNLLHDPFCPLHCGRDHGGGARTLPGVEEIIGGSQVTSHEDSGHNRQDGSG